MMVHVDISCLTTSAFGRSFVAKGKKIVFDGHPYQREVVTQAVPGT